MKKWSSLVLLVCLISAGISSCVKNESTVTRTCPPVTVSAPGSEVDTLKAFLDSNHVLATQDSRGFFYSIDFSGGTDTAHPTTCSDVSVSYIGTLLNGKVVDSTGIDTPASFNLGGTIAGWQEAIPLLKANATMSLYLPPSLAYGASGYSTIPGNSYLIFKIKLFAFN